MSAPFRELTDEDIRQMAREAESLNDSLSLTKKKPRGFYYRRAAILLGVVPLKEMSVDEVAWYFAERMGRTMG